MTQLIGDVANRVLRLPKPSNTADALQPVFEAVSNGMHAIQDKFRDKAQSAGSLQVLFEDIRNSATYQVIVTDNGIGLDDERFNAFCTTDTAFKIARGGKGVGRLLWLDAFSMIHVNSIFEEGGRLYRRTFDFSLSGVEPIFNEELSEISGRAETGTAITLTGLRSNSYATAMPVQFAVIQKHFASHFLADFLLGKAPAMTVSFEDRDASFPQAVNDLLVEKRESVDFTSNTFGDLTLDGYIMKKEASSDLDGSHQMHLVSSGRTVQTRKIDGLLGVKKIGPDNDSVLHCCVTGPFLDERVNQERTQFNFGEDVAADLTKECVDQAKANIVVEEVSSYEDYRIGRLDDFVEYYPSFGFEDTPSLLKRTPVSADNHEAFAKALIPHKIRADKDRREQVQAVLDRLMTDEGIQPDLSEEIRKVAAAASADENRQLMEYVIRRKFIIEILDALLGKVRVLSGKFDTHLEGTFHQLICPMRVVGNDPYRTAPASHDLWLLDERLAPAKYFASDARIEDFMVDGDKDRVDLMIWDKVHGLGLGHDDKLSRVLLVEFKKPERTGYSGNYVLGRQMNRYIEKLKNREVRSHTGTIVELSEDVVFHCYVVADIVGDLEADTRNWNRSPSGRGRFQYLQGDDKGTIEVVEWKELVRDAKVRNQNFLEAARLSFTQKGDRLFAGDNTDQTEAAE
ncbi:hypothetical protein GTA62_13155 [Roseobacter sp. HKCCD9010]|uniref:hypothetical protein n=1 Tax=unclassified Roseobacter TaxID=196798 RepID=UPI001492D676|nr:MULTISPECIES: hypothetical protein [unclassified Roseobacter]MBF9049868.1 hypothetical protein [Rhodobacterales bacterium HKCCD4356]NNV13593.1 hypothetical protein [Roseobacter sp. HKCCD7357]NNV16427.1 hypothetical protein [Roseobacter sp. HKCCD8768]NNV25886.1 hypothetical protein [Roseobacter sp. HKCCD8192]NNV30144.1 hypothetical protein [Roseobacter sp. HKCCD9061]